MTPEHDALVAKLVRKSFRREQWHEPVGMVDVPCDHDDDGAEAYFVNPDGPKAAQAIAALSAEVARLTTEHKAAQSNSLMFQGFLHGTTKALRKIEGNARQLAADPMTANRGLWLACAEDARAALKEKADV